MIFDYPRTATLDVAYIERRSERGVVREELSYASPADSRVTATLLAPDRSVDRKELAGISMLHWGFGNRASFASEGEAYARPGAMVLLIDAPGMTVSLRPC